MVGRTALGVLAALLLLIPAASQAASDERCKVDGAMLSGGQSLTRTVRLLNAHRPLRIVAIGSSSTQGFGASEPRQAYPAQLAALLKTRFPSSVIHVANKGIGGDDTVGMVERFPRDVYPERPDLVIWQTGTNDAIRQMPLPRFKDGLARGLKELKAFGADVILMTSQYSPAFIGAKDYQAYQQATTDAAEAAGVALFDRFRLSEAWYFDRRFAGAPVLAPDGLHQTDAGYHCDAVLLADGLTELVSTRAAALR